MKKLLTQVIKFFGLSGMGWLLDFTVYTLLSLTMSNLFISNICSSLVGASFVFIFSTRYVFKTNAHLPVRAKYLIYILYQIVLIVVMSRILDKINMCILLYFPLDFVKDFSPTLSKVLVTPITMVLNYFIAKGIIEKL